MVKTKRDKKILFIMPRLPFPAVSGRKTSLYHYCKILSELGFYLIVAAFLEKGDDPAEKPKFIDELIVLPKPAAGKKIFNILKNSIIRKKYPMQVSLYWSDEVKHIIDGIMQQKKPDIAIADMVRTTEYIRDVQAFRIADLDDRISLRYQRQLRADLSGLNPYGAYLNTLPSMLQKIMLWQPIKKYVIENEIKLLQKYELEISRACDKTVLVAKNEADTLNSELKKDKAISVPIGVDTEYFKPQESLSSNPYIAFLGALNVAHNEDAVRHFIKNIFPYILDKMPNAVFKVIGGGASEKLLAMRSKNIVFTGRVDDVRTELASCRVFICPMTFGSGIKTKILEAMAMGLPIVTTAIGAENIDAAGGKDWFIEDDPDKFADKVCFLLDNPDKGYEIGMRGRKYVESNWTWERAKNQFEKILAEIN